MPVPPLRVLVIGTGSIGRRHIDNLRDIDPATHFVLLRDGAREDDYSRGLGADVVGTIADALAATPTLAVLANPSDRHAEVLVPLLEAGVATFVEKPIVIAADDVRRLETLSGAAPTQVGCVLRFLPSLRRAKSWIDAGRLGRVVRAGFEVGQYLPDWRPAQDYRRSYSADRQRGGGVVLDLVHEIDLACWLLDDELALVGACGGTLSHLEITSEDVAALLLQTPEGAPATIQLDYVSRMPVRRLSIVGDLGTVTWDLRRRELILATDAGIEERIEDGFDVKPAYVEAMRELVEAVTTGAPTSLPLEAGLAATRLAIAANAHLRDGATA
jgi:predicted dehydrogenase